MQIPKQIYFKQTTPKGGKLTATIDGDDLPNVIQVKGTNDINPVKRRREHEKPDRFDRFDRNDDIDDDDEYDRDEHGCHRQTVGVWESKNKYTTLKQTLLFIKKRHCKRVVQEASYDEQGKLIEVTPTSVIKDGAIALVDKTVEIKWTADKEILVKEYNAESKLAGTSTWKKFDIDVAMGAGTSYTSSETPTVTGSYDYRLVAVFTDDTTKELLTSPAINVVVPTGGSVTIRDFTAQYNVDAMTIDVNWNSVTEESLVTYSVQLKGTEPDAQFFEAASADAIGAGQIYAANIFEDTGDYTLRLVGIFADGTSKEIENTVVPIGVPVM
jgi:hypothetical protein